MFSEGALIVGFSDIDSPGGSTVNPAKAAGLRLGDRVIRIGQIRTENNDAVKEALEAARGSAAEVIYVRSGEQRSTTLTPVWDATAAQWRAGMWVRDSSAGVGTLTFVDPEKGVETLADALQGANDIVAELLSDDAAIRKTLRELLRRQGRLRSLAATEEDTVYRLYYDFDQPIAKLAGHQILAINRGEKEGVLTVTVLLVFQPLSSPALS